MDAVFSIRELLSSKDFMTIQPKGKDKSIK